MIHDVGCAYSLSVDCAYSLDGVDCAYGLDWSSVVEFLKIDDLMNHVVSPSVEDCERLRFVDDFVLRC